MGATIYGRTIWTELSEIFEPDHTALIVVDPQNDFLDPAGVAAKRGVDVELLRTPIPRLTEVVPEARTRVKLTVFLQFTQHPDGKYLSDSDISRLIRDQGGQPPNWAIEGTWGHQFIPELPPDAADIIVAKHRGSGFPGTDLDQILRSNGIRSVVLVGVTTSGCVMYTARDAMMHDYFVGVLTDCIGSQRQDWHDATVLVMSRLFHYVGHADRLLEIWGRGS